MAKKEKSGKSAPETKAQGANVTLSKTAKIALRREKISELMLAGQDDANVRRMTAYLISQGFECGKSTVANDIKFIIAEAVKKTNENLEEKREFNNKRLESLIAVHWLPAQRGDIKSGRFVQDLINDQNELFGLKAAQKLEHSNPDGSGLMEPVAAAVNQFNAGLLEVYGGNKPTGNDKQS